jgi:hypothetical protein
MAEVGAAKLEPVRTALTEFRAAARRTYRDLARSCFRWLGGGGALRRPRTSMWSSFLPRPALEAIGEPTASSMLRSAVGDVHPDSEPPPKDVCGEIR